MLNINELSERTGLTVRFIRTSLNSLNDILNPHIKRGEFNSLLFEDGAIAIYNRIKYFKDKNYTIPIIRETLKKELNKEQETGKTQKANYAA